MPLLKHLAGLFIPENVPNRSVLPQQETSAKSTFGVESNNLYGR